MNGTSKIPTVVLVGAGGFGATHLATIQKLELAHRVRLTGIVDPTVPPDDAATHTYAGAPLFNTLSDAISAISTPNIVVIATPIHLHASMTREALLAGSDVLLEKPPFATLADFQEIRKVEQETGGRVQVGFQSLGSDAVIALKNGDLPVGQVKAIRGSACWLRTAQYFSRAGWVGRKAIGDTEINDGVLTNSLAHAAITALHIAGVKDVEDVGKVEIERYRANVIDVDDTTSVRITPARGGPIVTLAVTLCASVQTPPKIQVVGDTDTATLAYVSDEITLASTSEAVKYGRTNLLENLIDHRTTGVPLISPLSASGSFMRVAEAIRLSPDPTHISRKWITTEGEGLEAHRVVHEAENWIDKAVGADSLFSEVGCPWSFTGRDQNIYRAELGDRTMFDILDGQGTPSSSSPRPYIHSIRTLLGVQVTATRPADHCWHMGMGFAVPDVNGTSFWGGGTYVDGKGYVNLENHGRMVPTSLRPIDNGITHQLDWIDHTGQLVLKEEQTIKWFSFPGASAWRLSFRITVTAVGGPVSFGSPGTNGRKNAGYGGWTWRLPRCSKVAIMSSDAEGEDAIHGTTHGWIAWAARFEGQPGANGNATIVVVPADEMTAMDPWIVRCASYPGIGSALAWEERVDIGKGDSLSRGFEIAVVDGILTRAQAGEVALQLGSK